MPVVKSNMVLDDDEESEILVYSWKLEESFIELIFDVFSLADRSEVFSFVEQVGLDCFISKLSGSNISLFNKSSVDC